MVETVESRLTMLIVLIVVACGGFLHGYWSVPLIIEPILGEEITEVFISSQLAKLMVGIERAAIYTFIVGTLFLIDILWAKIRGLITEKIRPTDGWIRGFWQPPSEE
jgi:hypothetical protein